MSDEDSRAVLGNLLQALLLMLEDGAGTRDELINAARQVHRRLGASPRPVLEWVRHIEQDLRANRRLNPVDLARELEAMNLGASNDSRKD